MEAIFWKLEHLESTELLKESVELLKEPFYLLALKLLFVVDAG